MHIYIYIKHIYHIQIYVYKKDKPGNIQCHCIEIESLENILYEKTLDQGCKTQICDLIRSNFARSNIFRIFFFKLSILGFRNFF